MKYPSRHGGSPQYGRLAERIYRLTKKARAIPREPLLSLAAQVEAEFARPRVEHGSATFLSLVDRLMTVSRAHDEYLAAVFPAPDPDGCATCGLKPCQVLCGSKLEMLP